MLCDEGRKWSYPAKQFLLLPRIDDPQFSHDQGEEEGLNLHDDEQENHPKNLKSCCSKKKHKKCATFPHKDKPWRRRFTS
jgi:hypothetical protein